MKYSFGLRPEAPKKFNAPAPGAYNPEKADDLLDGSVKSSFGLKPEEPKKFVNPSPNAYELAAAAELLETQLSYTFGLRPERKIKFITPAPTDYRPEDCMYNSYRKRITTDPFFRPNPTNMDKIEFIYGRIQIVTWIS